LQQAYVKASNTGTGDEFGTSVALSGDGNTLAVSAIGADAVYVFERGAGVWSQQAHFTNAGGFGTSVALSGDGNTLAAGAASARAVYVFERNAGDWSQQAFVTASDTDTDGFGNSVALNSFGNVLAVGAPNRNIGAGAAYYFIRDNSGLWALDNRAYGTDSADNFGTSVALSPDGRFLAVGAPGEDSAGTETTADVSDNSAVDAGAVYVFAFGTAPLGPSDGFFIKASNTDAGDRFGTSVALAARADDSLMLAVAAPREDSPSSGVNGEQFRNSAADTGAVYTYWLRSGIPEAKWVLRSELDAYVKPPFRVTGIESRLKNHARVSLSVDGNSLAVSSILDTSSATGVGADPTQICKETDRDCKISGAVLLY
jgi:hypothetical protein